MLKDCILSMYDVTEIQKYVFSSNKLKDNIGASTLVEKCFNEFLVRSIKETLPEGTYNVDWKNDDGLKMEKDERIKAEVVYIGGGNAVLLFRDEEVRREVNKCFSKAMLLSAPSLNFVTAGVKVSGNFYEDMNNLFTSIKRKKYEQPRYVKLKGISITRECPITGLPVNGVCDRDKDRVSYASAEIIKKREAESAYDGDNRYKELDDLTGNNKDRYMAVVHIDGNKMGKKFNDCIKGIVDYNEAIKAIRKFSNDIDESYKLAFKKMMEFLGQAISNSTDMDEKNIFKDKNGNIDPPVRKILINGDDVTFVCYGKIALSAVEVYLRFLNEILKQKGYNDLGACAGIAIVKPHFPFSTAYKIAEQCCKSAKFKARNENSDGNWIDFHIVYSGVTSELSDLRSANYNVPYKEKPIGSEQYNLLWRPYKILDTNTKYSFEVFKKIYHEIKKWPRSKSKSLRNAYIKGEEDVLYTMALLRSRGLNLPKDFRNFNISEEDGFDASRMTPYFDVLDTMDMFVDLSCKEEE